MFYIVFDFAMAVIMFLFGIWFYRSKGQASKFLSGYNMKSAEERKNSAIAAAQYKYDEIAKKIKEALVTEFTNASVNIFFIHIKLF